MEQPSDTTKVRTAAAVRPALLIVAFSLFFGMMAIAAASATNEACFVIGLTFMPASMIMTAIVVRRARWVFLCLAVLSAFLEVQNFRARRDYEAAKREYQQSVEDSQQRIAAFNKALALHRPYPGR